ncbi:GNAT family N-acetyltransferase [Clostridium sp. DSM 100503]|uniref:GNAT family N-acetyltransferase n=1 Tax=Clostridium sp. DSM 100503 TaxID=2963282 RepID=UPI00214A737C|nr:GNAT family N-acetyltransferase [Clostridium sp. DSM 100503]MCR1949584.1 GNAT family N-acetyltransferase [Clostridium sp. DSM 100503]
MKLEFVDKEDFNKIVDELKDLNKVCLNKDLSRDYFLWRYLNNPIDDFILCIARENNKMIASYLVLPINLVVDDEIIKSGISMPILVRPDFRNNGLSCELAIKVYEKLKERDYKLLLGFPNEICHYNLVKKFGFEDIYEIPTLKLEIKDKDIYHINRCDIQKVYIDNEYNFNYSLVLRNDSNKIKIYKDANYLRWLFRENPMEKYNNYVVSKNKLVLASIVFKKCKNKIEILELNSIDKEYTKILLCKLFRDSIEEAIENIEICCSIYNKDHRVLEELGFKNDKPITYFTVKRINYLDNKIDDFKNWFIQMSDFKDSLK